MGKWFVTVAFLVVVFLGIENRSDSGATGNARLGDPRWRFDRGDVVVPVQTIGGNRVFEAEPKIREIAQAYSLDMIDFARKQFGADLDWSDESIREVERIAGFLHESYLTDRPSPEQIEPFYKMIGSYMGEVFRRNHGAEWGIVTLNGERFPGMKRKPDQHFWPWDRAKNRIVNGREDNLWHYYMALLGEIKPAAP